jgi:Secretion system C-terminal sorting domain
VRLTAPAHTGYGHQWYKLGDNNKKIVLGTNSSLETLENDGYVYLTMRSAGCELSDLILLKRNANLPQLTVNQTSCENESLIVKGNLASGILLVKNEKGEAQKTEVIKANTPLNLALPEGRYRLEYDFAANDCQGKKPFVQNVEVKLPKPSIIWDNNQLKIQSNSAYTVKWKWSNQTSQNTVLPWKSGQNTQVTAEVKIGSCVFNLTYDPLINGLDEDLQNALQVYPNPTQDRLEINIGNAHRGSLKISVFSMQGKEIFGQTLHKASENISTQIDFGHLPAGIYMLYLQTEKGFALRKVEKN